MEKLTKFNEKATTKIPEIMNTATTNYEGGPAWKMSDPLWDLYLQAATCLVQEPKYYEHKDKAFSKLQIATRNAIKVDPLFVLKLAVYCREKLFLRSVPLFLVNEVAYQKSEPIDFGSRYVSRVIQRADELAELLALSLSQNKIQPIKGKMPLMIKKGLKQSFRKFDEYQFGKYKGNQNVVKLRDVLFLTHPKPIYPDQQELYDKIANDTLAIPETWETYISANGSNMATWTHIYPKMGYMALLRNLRNFIQHTLSWEDVHAIGERLADPNQVANSKQLPFRFLSAYRAIKGYQQSRGIGWYRGATNEVLDSARVEYFADQIKKALNHSVKNLPRFDGNTVIGVDTSGSMTSTVSAKSVVQMVDIATIFGAMSSFVYPSSEVFVFGENCKKIDMRPPEENDPFIMENALRCLTPDHDSWVGHSTNGWKVIRHLNEHQGKFSPIVDRIILFTDCQLWDSTTPRSYYTTRYDYHSLADEFFQYRKHVNPQAKLYCVDLSGYGDLVLPEKTPNVYLLAGWSDHILNLMSALEANPNVVMDTIHGITPWGLIDRVGYRNEKTE